jgi:hypothetical protein
MKNRHPWIVEEGTWSNYGRIRTAGSEGIMKESWISKEGIRTQQESRSIHKPDQ